jgi:tetraacyldisaccharide 4'-kinase
MLAWDYGSPDVFLLDDGFQHRRLDRDLDIVVIRAPKPFGNGKFLPAGPLREPPEALGRADLLIINMTFDRDRGARVARRIASMFPSVPLLQAEYRPHRLWAWQGKEEGSLPLNAVTGQRVAVLCGIGNAKGFREMVSGLGARVVKSLFFPDHYWYTPVDITSIRRMLREVDAVITTEKDIWKLIRAGAGDEPILALQVEFEIESVHVLKEYLRSCISATDGRPVK